VVPIAGWEESYSLRYCFQIRSGTRSASYSVGTEGILLGVTEAG